MYSGKLVRLRAYRKEDVPQVQAYLNQSEIKRNLSPGVPFPMTLEDEEQWYASQSFQNPNYNFAVETLKEKQYIGGCGMKEVDWKNRHLEVGIFLGPEEYRGKGYGTDAMRVLIGFIFNEMNMHKIKLDVYAFNSAAVNSYLKCGFTEEARFKDELYREGRYHDIIRMVIFKTAYENRNP